MRNELRIKIGGIKTSIRSDNPYLLERIGSVYRGLLSSGSSHIELVVRVKKLPFLKGEESLSMAQDLMTLKEDGLEGYFDFKKRKGEVSLPPVFLIERVINFLKNIYSVLIINKGGVVLHASGILRQGKAHIFFGPSASGKSTVARLSISHPYHGRGCVVLDEELVFIEPVDGVYNAFGQRLPGVFPIQAIYKLSKDREVYLRKFSLPQALSEVFTVPWPLKDLAWQNILLANFYRLIRAFPCFDLHFRLDNSFWRCIDEYSQDVSR